jgi:hypothetical protein
MPLQKVMPVRVLTLFQIEFIEETLNKRRNKEHLLNLSCA